MMALNVVVNYFSCRTTLVMFCFAIK